MCFCTPSIRAPFCGNCNQAMFLRVNELRAENAELRKQLNTYENRSRVGIGLEIEKLHKQLAAAQATIEQMREALCWCAGWLDVNDPYEKASKQKVDEALALPTNQDALHEVLARECERLAERCSKDSTALGKLMRQWLLEEAATHRARKQATKEEGK